MSKDIKLLVGPTTLPKKVMTAMDHEVFGHRGKYYEEIHKSVVDKLGQLIGTKEDVILLTSSGTGGMEAAIQNCFSIGDKVIAPIIGNFGERFADIAETYGLIVDRVYFELGETADISKAMERVNKDTKGVIIVHNESSTGVYNDIEALGKELRNKDVLLVTDSVSGLGGLKINMDDWGIDVVVSSSQKALMSPPGISPIALSKKAWERVEQSNTPTYYFNLKKARKMAEVNQTPWTPATHTLLAMKAATEMIFDEGLENVYKRHKVNQRILIEGIEKMGYSIFAKNATYASPTLTAIKTPMGSKRVVDYFKENNILISAGLAPIKDEIIRVGTMGFVYEKDILEFLRVMNEFDKTI